MSILPFQEPGSRFPVPDLIILREHIHPGSDLLKQGTVGRGTETASHHQVVGIVTFDGLVGGAEVVFGKEKLERFCIGKIGLCRASENHLRAFVRVLRLYNVEYEPVVLDRTEFDRIMDQ